ncbi:IS3 family transposase [Aminivibrio sp.]|uniref:IS3 family transposase n=1 Tax=Aminivibrio sp. TaxID=1872489 RepID=UPI001A52DA9E|nr:IS3 family transposase [Aminivibrio sp.]
MKCFFRFSKCLKDHFKAYETDIYINEYITPKEMIAAVNKYIYDYNAIRPHASLGGLTPDAFARQQKIHAA